MASHDRDRAVALGLQLTRAHQELRRQLRQLRLDDGVLLTHCLAFCGALTAHHREEDTGLFAQALREQPELAGTVAKLIEDHELIAAILRRVAELERGGDLGAIGRELDGLAAIMESHFRYEERVFNSRTASAIT